MTDHTSFSGEDRLVFEYLLDKAVGLVKIRNKKESRAPKNLAKLLSDETQIGEDTLVGYIAKYDSKKNKTPSHKTRKLLLNFINDASLEEKCQIKLCARNKNVQFDEFDTDFRKYVLDKKLETAHPRRYKPAIWLLLGALTIALIWRLLVHFNNETFFDDTTKITILVLPISELAKGETKKNNYHIALVQELDELRKDSLVDFEVKTYQSKSLISTYPKAEEIGKKLDADIVFFGSYEIMEPSGIYYTAIRYTVCNQNITNFKLVDGGSEFSSKGESVVQDIRRGILKDKVSDVVLPLMAYHQYVISNWEHATSIYKRCHLSIKNGNEGSMNVYGSCLNELGLYQEAVTIWKELYEYDTLNRSYGLNYSVALMHSDEYPKAENILIKILQTHPDYAKGHGQLAKVYSHRGDYDNAIIKTRKSLSISPHDSISRFNLAILYLFNKDTINATKQLLAYEKEFSEDKDIMSQLGFVYYKSNSELSKNYFLKSLKLDSSQKELYPYIDSLNSKLDAPH
jgi:tetratricopeptide (TPR) repeat protein